MKLKNIILSIFCLLITNLNAISLREYITTNGMPEIEMSEGNFILNLSNKNLTDLDGLNEIPGITQVTILDLNNNQLSTFSEGLFNILVNLKYLDLSNNQISELSQNIFNTLVHLIILKLNNNQLRKLPEGIFHALINLQNLKLNNNQISELSQNIFNTLVNLQNLKLNNNQLRKLPEGIFHALINLQDLDLSNNQISELSQNIFSTLVNLEYLYLTNNQIKELSECIFNKLINLKHLFLNDNKIRELPKDIFNKLVNLISLVLFNNPIKLTTEEFRTQYLTIYQNELLYELRFKTKKQEAAEDIQRKLIEYIKLHNIYSINIILELLKTIKEWYPNLYVVPQTDENDNTALHLALQSRNLNLAQNILHLYYSQEVVSHN